MRLGHSDYRRFNDAVATMYRRAFMVSVAEAVAETVVQTLGGVNAVAGSLRGTQVLSFAATDPEFARMLIETTPQVARFHPRFNRAELSGKVVMMSDLLSRRVFHETELYNSGWHTLPYEDDLGVNIRLRNGTLMSVALMRERRTFREEDRAIFSLLLPHIETLLSPPPTPDPRALSGIGLTKREQEVLFWISEGKTNLEVAEILGISGGTVKRHLENLYPKLGVENRHGAARRALEKLGRFH